MFKEMAAEATEDMHPVSVEYLFDGDKAVFYFEAEERVDFRELVRKLAVALPRARRHAPDRRARRGPHGGRPGPLRPGAVLQAPRRRVLPRVHPHGQGAGPLAEPARRSRACAGGSCAVCATSSMPTRTSRAALPRRTPRWRRRMAPAKVVDLGRAARSRVAEDGGREAREGARWPTSMHLRRAHVPKCVGCEAWERAFERTARRCLRRRRSAGHAAAVGQGQACRTR